MKIHKYLVFPSIEAAIQFLDQLHTAMQNKEIWTDANLHPFDKRALVPWNDDYLNQYDHLITPIEKISQDEALDQGFLFGRLRGPFAHARAKLEEAQLLQSALVEASSIPNFPVYRALFFGFLSATYALKEALRKSCNRLGTRQKHGSKTNSKSLNPTPLFGLSSS